MNTIWIYSNDEPNLRERLMGMEFDRAILSEMARRDTGIRAHVLSRTRAAKAKEQNGHNAKQLKECNSLLDEALTVIELYAPNHELRSRIERWQATSSV